MELLPDRIQELLSELRSIEGRRLEIQGELAKWYSSISATMSEFGVESVAARADVPGAENKSPAPAGLDSELVPAQMTQREMVIQTVKSADRPLRTDDIQTMLLEATGEEIPASNVRAHLANAVQEGELVRLRRGVYAAEDTPRYPGLPMDESGDEGDDAEGEA